MLQEIEKSFVYLVIVFTALVFLSEFGIYDAHISFFLFAVILAILSLPLVHSHSIKDTVFRHSGVVLMLIIAFAFVFRVYMAPSVPPGYDAGFYKYGIDRYSHDISDNSMPQWIKAMFPQGLFVLLSVSGSVLGVDSGWILTYLFSLLAALVALPVFLVTRHYFSERSALLAAALYALSYTQYHAFLMVYFKTVLGISLLLFGIYFLDRKKYVPLALVFGALGVYHRPEFLLLGLVISFYLVARRDAALLAVMLASFALMYPFWQQRLDMFFSLVLGVAQSMASGEAGGGTFYSILKYRFLASAYMPFALIGILYALIRKKLTPLLVLSLINGVIVIFELFFYNRLIINLDIMLVIFAGAGMAVVFLDSGRIPRLLGYAAVVLLFLVLFSVTAKNASDFGPTIGMDQLGDIRSFDAPHGSFILAPSTEAPWVRGYTDFSKNYTVVSPGLFDDNGTEAEWAAFAGSADASYLNRYGKPFYVFHKEKFGNQDKFNNTCFRDFNPSFVEYVC